MSSLIKLDFANLSLLKRRRRSISVLGMTLDGSRLDGILVRRTNGSLQVQQTFSVTLSLDPLTNDPELVGREIRNHLAAAGVRERHCVVGLPLKWALTTHTRIPELPEADVASFLQIEAERGFPCDVSTLLVATSRCEERAGERSATLVGIPRNHVASLEAALRAAQLKPASFSLGLSALQAPQNPRSNGVLALSIGDNQVGLQITCGGGIYALRTLEVALEGESGQKRLQAEVLAREVRITLAQLPPETRSAVRRVRIFGPRDLAQQLADEFELRLETMELELELVTSYPAGEFNVQLPAGVPVTAAFSLAAGYLTDQPVALEFLPPHVTQWQQFAARYSSGKLQQAGLAAVAVFVLVGGAFAFQHWQYWRLQSQWAGMKSRVQAIEDTNAKIKQFRPWFDDSIRGLTILRRLTEAFPEDGSVTAKTVEIRDLATVNCTGTARDYESLLKTIAKLRDARQIPEVNLGQTRGQPPTIQFSFSFVWNEGGSYGN
jgi:hypothetical protein